MWWYIGIFAALIIVLGVVLARRGSSSGSVGHNTPGTEAHSLRQARDSGFGSGGV